MDMQTDIVGAFGGAGKKSPFASIAGGNTAGGLSRAAGIDGGTSGFAAQLNSQMLANGSGDPHARAQEAAEGLVSNALILPILKQVRRDADEQNTYFSPGMGEKTFGPEFDMQIADRIARSPRLGITHALAARLEKRAATASSGSHTRSAETLNVHG